MAYNAFADNTSIVNRLAVVASQICEIARKFELIAVQGHRSWCQWKAHKQLPICHYFNFGRISFRFRDIDAFSTPLLFDAPLAKERPAISLRR